MVERQTRKLEVLVPVTGVRVQIPPPTPEFRKRPLGRFFVALIDIEKPVDRPVQPAFRYARQPEHEDGIVDVMPVGFSL